MDFGATGQGGDSIIFSSFYKKYWEIGFKTRLYEWLCPEAYYDSLRRVAEHVSLKEGERVLDAGCGSGMLFPILADRLKAGGRYLGMDILPAGLAVLKLKARQSNLDDAVTLVQADLSRALPFRSNSIFCVAAHFSVYTLREEKDRRQAYQELWRVLKPGGILVTANPTQSYDAQQIIRASLESLENKISRSQRRIKKYLVYPLTLCLGLKHIERQIKSGRWHGYTPDELQSAVERTGFFIEHTETVYGGSGIIVVARKT